MIAPLLLLLQSAPLTVPSYLQTRTHAFDVCVEKRATKMAPTSLEVDEVAHTIWQGCMMEWMDLREGARRTFPSEASRADGDKALRAFENILRKRVRDRVVNARAAGNK